VIISIEFDIVQFLIGQKAWERIINALFYGDYDAMELLIDQRA
jgi:hypothetical protein